MSGLELKLTYRTATASPELPGPAGVHVESAAECDPSACPYYCYHTTCGSDAPGIWCEECDALEAFLDGACADCTIDLREGAIWANCGGAK